MVSIQKDVSLKNFSNYKIGGPAKFFAEVSSKEELIEVLRRWDFKIKPEKNVAKLFHLSGDEAGGVFILGAGTNVLISDKGFDGLVIHNKIKDIKSQRERESKSKRVRESESQRVRVRIGAGVLMDDLLNFCVQNSLSGLEWAGGLPGTLGGAVRGNAGAFRGEIKDAIVQIVSIANIANREGNFEIKTRSKEECHFGYRSSVFKSQSEKESKRKRVREAGSQSGEETEVIVSAVLKLTKGNRDNIEKEINEKIEYRKNRHPLEYPNIGSIFKNISIEKVPQKLLERLKDSIKDDPFPILPTAKLLALAGLKGKRVGEAMVSQKHPNFIVNLGRAASEDVQKLISEIKKIIKDKYGIELEEEINYLH